MARLAVLASGRGSNFQALALALGKGQGHSCALLVHDRRAAGAALRAAELGIPAFHIAWSGRPRAEAERELDELLRAEAIDLVALAGFMRLLSPGFVAAWRGRLVNIHPSILPAWPGADAIKRAYEAGELIFGASVHFVDEGMDSGPLIAQDSIRKKSGESLEALEERVHELEHRLYPKVIRDLLDGSCETGRMG